MKNLIDAYLDDMKLAWSPATVRSEKYRLSVVAEGLDGDPAHLWALIKDRAPYTKVTIWIRVCAFWDWLIDKGHKNENEYKKFREKNKRLFKNKYVRRMPKLTFKEATARINLISDIPSREKAKELIKTGMRYSESFTLQDGYVLGKGGKSRRVFYSSSKGSKDSIKYTKFWREVKKVGLKPHDLRKLCLNRLVDKGANEFELCQIAGWSNLNTAASYIRTDETKLQKLMEAVNEN